MKKLFIVIGIFIALGIGVRTWYGALINAVDREDSSRELVAIESGTSTDGIASLLKEKGLISSEFAFKYYVRSSGNAGKLQAGSFVLMRSMDVPALIGAMMSGKTAEEALTIPEGYTVQDIDRLLVSKELIEEGEFTTCAQTCDLRSDYSFLPSSSSLASRGGAVEGYLFADTYFIAPDTFDVESFIKRLLSTFEVRVLDQFEDELRTSDRTLHELVTMASLIEEETRTDDERAVVAGILWKRYDEGIGLGVDATVRYIINKPTAALTKNDLAVDSAYNLRKYRGLPPGPIASPSISSIRAALNPESSPYYYYLHGNDGTIRYAVTNDEHNLNKAKYLR